MRMQTDARSLFAGLEDRSVGLVITDPPWALYDSGRFAACASYERMDVHDIAAILGEAREKVVKGGHMYTWAPAGPELQNVLQEFTAVGWRFLRLLGWDKGVHRGLGAYRNALEPVLVFSNGPSRGFEKSGTYPSLLKARGPEYRTAKPWQLYKVFMEMSSKAGELVVDPFCGTNPLEKAAKNLQPARRWLAGDLETAKAVAADIKDRAWARSNGRPQPDGPRLETALFPPQPTVEDSP